MGIMETNASANNAKRLIKQEQVCFFMVFVTGITRRTHKVFFRGEMKFCIAVNHGKNSIDV